MVPHAGDQPGLGSQAGAKESAASALASAPAPIRILLVDDHPVVRKGIAACLSARLRLRVVGEAADGEEALRLAHQLQPDIMLMDIEMPAPDGLEVTRRLRQEQPGIRVLVLTMHHSSEHIRRVLECGARGCLTKSAPPDEVVAAIEAVHRGETFFSPELGRLALNHLVPADPAPEQELTSREREVLIFIANGLSNKEIASRLGVGVRTVETHRESVMRKLGIHTIAGLTKYAIAQGLVGFG